MESNRGLPPIICRLEIVAGLFLPERFQGDALFRRAFQVVMTGICQSPETPLWFRDPSLVFKQVQVVMND
jgi:hypothetical protein